MFIVSSSKFFDLLTITIGVVIVNLHFDLGNIRDSPKDVFMEGNAGVEAC